MPTRPRNPPAVALRNLRKPPIHLNYQKNLFLNPPPSTKSLATRVNKKSVDPLLLFSRFNSSVFHVLLPGYFEFITSTRTKNFMHQFHQLQYNFKIPLIDLCPLKMEINTNCFPPWIFPTWKFCYKIFIILLNNNRWLFW